MDLRTLSDGIAAAGRKLSPSGISKLEAGDRRVDVDDLTVIAYLLRPELFEGRHINVEIETRSELTMGATVADWWRVSGRPANTTFMRSADADGFYSLLCERLAVLP